MKRQAVIVAGLMRSGTSLLGGVLDALGFWMGDEFLPAGPHNAKGTFNCVALESWCDRAWPGLPHGWPVTRREHEISDESAAALKSLIDARVARGVPFGMKCTRLWCAAPQLAAMLNFPTKVICAVREPGRSVESLIVGLGAERDLTEELYSRAVPSLAYFRRRNLWSLLEVRFDDLIDRPAAEVGRIAEFLQVPVTPEAVAFPDAALRRF